MVYGFREFGEAEADKYFMAFFERFEQIANTQYLYQSVDYIRDGYRRSVCGVDSIYYRIKGEKVGIMRILGRQDMADLQPFVVRRKTPTQDNLIITTLSADNVRSSRDYQNLLIRNLR